MWDVAPLINAIDNKVAKVSSGGVLYVNHFICSASTAHCVTDAGSAN